MASNFKEQMRVWSRSLSYEMLPIKTFHKFFKLKRWHAFTCDLENGVELENSIIPLEMKREMEMELGS